MNTFLALVAIIIFCCVLLNNASHKVGIPVLLAFILLGIFVGNVDFINIALEDFKAAEKMCSIALIFIMFYGGFGTRWKTARPVAAQAAILATAGVAVTAGVTGLFCHFVLHWNWLESMLMGAVISSTDAASVFSILRSKNLGLKNGTSPLLEMESGSNDPMSYMLTALMLSLMGGSASGAGIAMMLVKQIVLGAGIGYLIARGAILVMRRISFATAGFDSLFVLAIALFSYAVPGLLGGNGYLSAYIVGIILGNTDFRGRKSLVHFFDGITGLMQVLIFFALGLLAQPEALLKAALPAAAIFLCLLFISRPASVFSVLPFFKRFDLHQQSFISFVGLRGAASIVFAITATLGAGQIEHDIFSTVFVIVLISIALQGSLIPLAARKMDVIDPEADAKTFFNDFAEQADLQFHSMSVTTESPWAGKTVKELGLDKGTIICMLIRADGSRLIPNGDSRVDAGDSLILCSKEFRERVGVNIIEREIRKESKWNGHMVRDYPCETNQQLLMIKRKDTTIIPHGDTILQAGDILYINKG